MGAWYGQDAHTTHLLLFYFFTFLLFYFYQYSSFFKFGFAVRSVDGIG